MATTQKRMSNSELNFYNAYSNNIKYGKNDLNQLQKYNSLVKNYGLKSGVIANDALRDYSIKALNGDTNAQNYLKAMHASALSGTSLWKDYDPTKLKVNSAAYNQYLKDNPYNAFTKTAETNQYNQFNSTLANNGAMSPEEQAQYANITSKWNLDNMTDPYIKAEYQLKKDKQASLDAQDVALNQGLQSAEQNNFQSFLNTQQGMTDRGMQNTGIAQDAYLRGNMAANQDYQKLYSQAATQKADMATQFDEKIAQNDIANYTAKQKAMQDAINAQSDQDKWMTQYTGFLYVNGQRVTDENGQPINTVDYMKTLESMRHNMASEGLDATKISNDYNLGMYKATNDYNLGQDKLSVDLQKALMNNQLNYAKLDFNYAKLSSDTQIAMDKINVAIANAQTKKDALALKGVSKKYTEYSKQIQAYQKRGETPPEDLVKKFNNAGNAINNLVQTGKYDGDSGGTAKIGSMGSYNNYWKTQKQFSKSSTANTFVKQLNTVVKSGQVPQSWMKGLIELAGRESGWNPRAKNPTSTAHGYAQFLNSTERAYKKRYPNLDYSNPTDQIVLMYHYVKERYGNINKALQFWDSHNWY